MLTFSSRLCSVFTRIYYHLYVSAAVLESAVLFEGVFLGQVDQQQRGLAHHEGEHLSNPLDQFHKAYGCSHGLLELGTIFDKSSRYPDG